MALGVTIRAIRAGEGPAFRAIRLQSVGESATAFGSTVADIEARPAEYWEWRAVSGAEGSENIVLVAEDAGRWVGVVGGFVGEGEKGRYVDLISMWVYPAYRRRGVGLRLIERLVAWAKDREARRVVLWVTEGNDAAIALYRRAGFVDTGESQPHPLQAGLREVQMTLEL